jgi:transcriptional regulator with XRE-family HTH domain
MTDPGAARESAFAVLIRETRKLRGWSQEELADRSGVSRPTLQRWENGQITEPAGSQVSRVSEALEIDPEDAYRALGWLPQRRVGVSTEGGRYQVRQLRLAIMAREDWSNEKKLEMLDKLVVRLRELGETERFIAEIGAPPGVDTERAPNSEQDPLYGEERRR